MQKVVVSRQVLDQMIRSALAGIGECTGVKPMPVTPCPRKANGANWTLPGWTGDSGAVRVCQERMDSYLKLLGTRFEIPEEE